MPRQRRDNIDRKSNKPDPKSTETPRPDLKLNRATEIRRDDDVIRTPKRTLYDIDYAMKWFIDQEIQPQITHNGETIPVQCIFANGEKWDNVRRLGYMRDEKGKLQSPVIVLKRNSVSEREQLSKLDVNRKQISQARTYKQRYNKRNRYSDSLLPAAIQNGIGSEELYIVNIPRYVTIAYDLMIWTDFTTQMNDLVSQFIQYKGMHWGNESNTFQTMLRDFSFETVNTVGEDRLVRATTTLDVKASLLAEHEFQRSTLQKAYSIKKVRFDVIVDVPELFTSLRIPDVLQNYKQYIYSKGVLLVTNGATGDSIGITKELMDYLVNLTEKQATYVNETTVTISGTVATNPLTSAPATKAEFDLYVNGQYIDKAAYEWTPNTSLTQTITFDSEILGYNIEADDLIIVNGRWNG